MDCPIYDSLLERKDWLFKIIMLLDNYEEEFCEI